MPECVPATAHSSFSALNPLLSILTRTHRLLFLFLSSEAYDSSNVLGEHMRTLHLGEVPPAESGFVFHGKGKRGNVPSAAPYLWCVKDGCPHTKGFTTQQGFRSHMREKHGC